MHNIFKTPPGTADAKNVVLCLVYPVGDAEAPPIEVANQVSDSIAMAVINQYNEGLRMPTQSRAEYGALVYSWTDHDGYLIATPDSLISIECMTEAASRSVTLPSFCKDALGTTGLSL